MRIEVYCGSGLGNNPIYAEKASELGTVLAQHGQVLFMEGLK